MSGFISSPPPPASPDGATVEAGPFWPSVDVNHFRDAMRIGGQEIPEPRVREALIGAIITADDNLGAWRAEQEAAGHATLLDVPVPEIANISKYVLLWRRAVFAFACADLIETHRDVTATRDGGARAENERLAPDDHRRNGIHAIRDMRGERRTAVELI